MVTHRYDASTELTFTDNQDLAFLKSGDLLTSSAVTALTPAMSTTLYTGNSGTQTINTGIDNTNKSLVWTKRRNSSGTESSDSHYLFDTERGVGNFQTEQYK